MTDELEIDYNDQFFIAFRAGFDAGRIYGSADDFQLWTLFLEFLEEGEDA